MPIVTFLPKGKQFNVKLGGSLLRAARRARMPIASSCGGEGVCLACRVQIIEGWDNLSPLSERENQVRKQGRLYDNERIACLACVYGPVSITTSYW